jgi:hypothetical protein
MVQVLVLRVLLILVQRMGMMFLGRSVRVEFLFDLPVDGRPPSFVSRRQRW